MVNPNSYHTVIKIGKIKVRKVLYIMNIVESRIVLMIPVCLWSITRDYIKSKNNHG